MTREFSAGGIVFSSKGRSGPKDHRPLAEAFGRKKQKEELLWLVCQHSQHKGWVFPKGLIGDNIEGEKNEQTAVREVKEEAGVEGKIITKLKNPATYWYVWQGDKRFKTVYYFLMEYVSGDIKNHDFEMSEVEWLPTDKVMERLTYKSDKQAFEEVLQLIAHMKIIT